MKEDLPKGPSESGALTSSLRSQGLKKSLSGQRATMARLCEEGMILSHEFSSILLWVVIQLTSSFLLRFQLEFRRYYT